MNKNPLDAVDPLGLFGISGTLDTNLTGAIHNPLSVPKGSLGVTLHSQIDTKTNVISVTVEAESELYNLAKLRKPNMKALQNGSDIRLSAEGLASFLNEVFDLDSYKDIYLMSCNLAKNGTIDEFTNELFAQAFSSAIKKKTFAYSAYIVGQQKDNTYSFSGYYTDPVAFRKRNLGLSYINWNTTYVESKNAIDVRREFNPQ